MLRSYVALAQGDAAADAGEQADLAIAALHCAEAPATEALTAFFHLREAPGLKKKPSTSELLDWLKLLLAEDIPLEVLREKNARKAIPPLYGALLKNEADVQLFEKLAFLARRG